MAKKDKHASDEEEQPKGFKRNPRNLDDESNKLKMDEHHRIIRKPLHTGPRKHSKKKQARDIERFLQQKNLPEEVKAKKEKELKELHLTLKQKKEAEKFELRYKKVKFIEKRKVIRQLEKAKKQLQGDPSNKDLQAAKQEWHNKLTYIDNFPVT